LFLAPYVDSTQKHICLQRNKIDMKSNGCKNQWHILALFENLTLTKLSLIGHFSQQPALNEITV